MQILVYFFQLVSQRKCTYIVLIQQCQKVQTNCQITMNKAETNVVLILFKSDNMDKWNQWIRYLELMISHESFGFNENCNFLIEKLQFISAVVILDFQSTLCKYFHTYHTKDIPNHWVVFEEQRSRMNQLNCITFHYHTFNYLKWNRRIKMN